MGIFQFYPQDLKSHVSMTRLESSLFGLGEFWFTNSWPVTSTRRSWLCVWAPGRHLTWGTWNTSRSPSVCTHVSLPRQSSIEQGLSWTFWSSRGCGGQRWSLSGPGDGGTPGRSLLLSRTGQPVRWSFCSLCMLAKIQYSPHWIRTAGRLGRLQGTLGDY